MTNSQKPFTIDRTVRLVLSIGAIWVTYLVLRNLSDVLTLFAIALLIAYLINPIVDFFQRKLKYRLLAITVTILLIFIILTAAGFLIIPLLSREINHMWEMLSALVQGTTLTDEAQERLPKTLWQYLNDLMQREDVQEFFQSQNFKSIIQQLEQKLLPGVWGVVTGLVSFLIGLFGLTVIFLYVIFILKDYSDIRGQWKDLIPKKYKQPVTDFYEEFKKIMNKYFRGQALVASTVGVLFATGFFIIGLPLGILIGLFMGILNMVPYLQILGFLPIIFASGIYALDHQSSFFVILGLSVLVVAIVQTFQDTFLVPKIMGKVTGFNPAMILLSLSVWGKLLGLFGLLIALPFTYLILAYYRKYVLKENVLQPGAPPGDPT